MTIIYGGLSLPEKTGCMYNPFVLLTNRLLESLIKAGNTHFVRQTFKRGNRLHNPYNGSFLITHYRDAYQAQIHFDALAGDPDRFLYNTGNPVHYQKLQMASMQPEGYRIYSPLTQQSWKPAADLAAKIRKYISEKTDWSPGRSDSLKTELFVQFGELFVILKYGFHEIKLPLEEIENF